MKFEFCLGGFDSGHFELILKREHLNCFISDYPFKPPDPTHRFSVKEDPDWQQLVHFLETLKWKANYDNGWCDGIQWTLVFKSQEKHLTCYGSNVFPRGFSQLTKLHAILIKHDIVFTFAAPKRR